MKTILVFTYGHELGTTHVLVALGLELKMRGYNVIFASQGPYMDYIRNAGFETADVVEIDYETHTHFLRQCSLEYHDIHSIEKFVAEELKLIESIKPVLIIDINRPTSKISAIVSKVKRVSISNTILTKYSIEKMIVPETHALSLFTNLKFLKFFLEAAAPLVSEAQFRGWVRPYNSVLKKYSRPERFESMRDLFEGDLTLLMDAKEFAPARELPNSVQFVGPILHVNRLNIPDWFVDVDQSKPSIFVSMGSTGALFAKVLEFLFEIRGELTNYNLIATTAGRHSVPNLAWPKNFYITDYIPADLVLNSNCKLNITHGGRGSVYHAMTCGVPMIGIPHQMEQEMNLNSVVRLGMGLKIPFKKMTLDIFKNSLKQILTDQKFRLNTERFKLVLANYQGHKLAAELIHKELIS